MEYWATREYKVNDSSNANQLRCIKYFHKIHITPLELFARRHAIKPQQLFGSRHLGIAVHARDCQYTIAL